MTHYVYMARCSDNSLYTGYTTDIEKRIATHNAGKGSKFVRGRRPIFLVYSESYESKSDALRREIEIKKMSKVQKEELALGVAKMK